jgi:hypothetical protein
MRRLYTFCVSILYFCTSKSSKASKASKSRAKVLDAAPVSCASVCVLSYQQYVYFCTSYIDKSSASVTSLDAAPNTPFLRQYLYFSASVVYKSTNTDAGTKVQILTQKLQGSEGQAPIPPFLRQFLYFCTSKESKLSTCECADLGGRWPVKEP